MPPISSPEPLRRLSAADAPMPGDLLPPAADTDTTERLVWTDISLWEHNPAWRAHPDGHLLAPVDAGSSPDGRGVLVAHCPERLRTWLAGRPGISDAEAVTVAISLLRGAGEADACGASEGSWWLTSTGRPVLAVGGAALWREETDALLAGLHLGGTAARSAAIDRTRAAIADPRRLRHEADHVEAALFAVSEPGPLGFAPVAAGASPAVRARSITDASDAAGVESPPPSALRAAVDGAVRRHVDAAWADRLREVWSRVASRRLTPSRPPASGPSSRPRVLLVGAGVAAAVLALGLWAPWEPITATPDGAVTSSPTPTPTPTRTASTPVPRSPSPATSAAGEDDLDAQAARVIGDLASCAAAGCPETVVEDAARPLPPGAATRGDGDRRITLVDDYGGVAVFRVARGDGSGDAEATEQIVVIVRAEDEWLVRDVYDVADQP